MAPSKQVLLGLVQVQKPCFHGGKLENFGLAQQKSPRQVQVIGSVVLPLFVLPTSRHNSKDLTHGIRIGYR